MIDNNIFVFENKYKLTEHLVALWIDYAQSVIMERGKFTAALSGGRTPVEFYCKLSNIDQFELWRDTEIYLTDERFVPPDHADSNTRLIRENLINYVFIEPYQFHPIPIEGDDPHLVAEIYEDELNSSFGLKAGQLPAFDLALLGIGEDGHVASLFSQTDLSRGAQRLVMATEPMHVTHKRVSLTLPVLNNARKVILIAAGKGKADILFRLIEKNEDFPASKLNPKDGRLVILADKFAAEKLLVSNDINEQGQIISQKK